MSICVEEVKNRRQLRQFVDFPKNLYKDCPYWVPAISCFELRRLSLTSKNGPSCSHKLFLAYKEGILSGRVAAIINKRSNELEGEKIVRFGWLDFICDIKVLEVLIEAVSEWGEQEGCTKMKGPIGFTDMDRIGVLVDGFGQVSSFNCSYNYPYYDSLLSQMGFVKDMDWIQRQVKISPELPKVFRHTKAIASHYGLRAVQAGSIRELVRRYGLSFFDVYNKAFAHLYAFSPIDREQARNYIRIYSPLFDTRLVTACVDSEDRLIGFIICLPFLSKAIQSSSGRLFPDGLLRIIRILKSSKEKTVEALIMAVIPEYWGSGAILLMLEKLHDNFLKRGIDTMIINPQQEKNHDALSLFNHFEISSRSRRRAYVRSIWSKGQQ